MAVEVECLLKVSVGLAEVAEAEPSTEVLRDVVSRVKLNEHLRNLLHNLVVGINAHSLTIAERNTCIIVLVHRLLIGEESVHVEVLERIDFGRRCPTQCLDVVDEQHGLALRGTRLGEVLLVDIVRL